MLAEDERDVAARQIIAEATKPRSPRYQMYPGAIYSGALAECIGDDLSMTVRGYRAFDDAGLFLVGDILRFYREEGILGAERRLGRLPGCGATTVREITGVYKDMERRFPDALEPAVAADHPDAYDLLPKAVRLEMFGAVLNGCVQFKTGDQVVLKSGGPVMTVDTWGRDDGAVECMWFGPDGKLEAAVLDIRCIRAAEPPVAPPEN
ncbi:YodC family protein [Mesorhizobium sp. A556]